jgi:hypothetical protein
VQKYKAQYSIFTVKKTAYTFRAKPTAIGETVENDLTTLIVAWAMPGLEIFEPASLRPKMRASV